MFLVLFPLSLAFVNIMSELGYPPGQISGLSPLKCPLKLVFGVSCPSCGLTRSILYAWNGNFAMSLHYHFGGLMLLFLSVLYYLVLVAGKQSWLKAKVLIWVDNPPLKVFLLMLIFLYSVWGFFLRNNN